MRKSVDELQWIKKHRDTKAQRHKGSPHRFFAGFLCAFVSLCLCVFSVAQNNWVYFGQDQGATKYSTLTQINTSNVKSLKRAWTFHTGDKSGFFESTPLVIDSVMYFSAQNGFFAIDAVTGQQIWKFDATQTTRRGVSYWPGDARSPAR